MGKQILVRLDNLSKLGLEINYWKSGLPNEQDIFESYTADGGVWGQPLHYEQIAHFIIPARFYWEKFENQEFTQGYTQQNIGKLSQELTLLEIPHRLTESVLEIKLY
jgi:hypothetical protein